MGSRIYRFNALDRIYRSSCRVHTGLRLHGYQLPLACVKVRRCQTVREVSVRSHTSSFSIVYSLSVCVFPFWETKLLCVFSVEISLCWTDYTDKQKKSLHLFFKKLTFLQPAQVVCGKVIFSFHGVPHVATTHKIGQSQVTWGTPYLFKFSHLGPSIFLLSLDLFKLVPFGLSSP